MVESELKVAGAFQRSKRCRVSEPCCVERSQVSTVGMNGPRILGTEQTGCAERKGLKSTRCKSQTECVIL